MEASKLHIQHVLLWEFRQDNSATTAMNKLCEIYGPGISVSQGQKWFQRFWSGNYSLEDEPRPGRLHVFDDDLLRTMVEQNPRITVEELAEQLNPYDGPSAFAKDR
ncbi:hypothetical protein KPH14_005212 [Odynerus spinipes]|uniref:Mos1 transposase HTH domain-containing protein n=1 Tax=Odynerus spinipes TaxID=1348599 RepID=A0AAD9RKY4_9HYME|nr:hypothetical protein KPH14_005212 [Odynerus spinipes]